MLDALEFISAPEVRKTNVEFDQAAAAISNRIDGSTGQSAGHNGELPYPDLPEISREELRRRLRDPLLTILDVHSPDVFAHEHLPRAINLPLPDVETRIRQVFPNLQTEIAIYCTKFT